VAKKQVTDTEEKREGVDTWTAGVFTQTTGVFTRTVDASEAYMSHVRSQNLPALK